MSTTTSHDQNDETFAFLLEPLAKYLTDMRLLKQITNDYNEFIYVYKNYAPLELKSKAETPSFQQKALATAVLKNLCPEEYDAIGTDESLLANLFSEYHARRMELQKLHTAVQEKDSFFLEAALLPHLVNSCPDLTHLKVKFDHPYYASKLIYATFNVSKRIEELRRTYPKAYSSPFSVFSIKDMFAAACIMSASTEEVIVQGTFDFDNESMTFVFHPMGDEEYNEHLESEDPIHSFESLYKEATTAYDSLTNNTRCPYALFNLDNFYQDFLQLSDRSTVKAAIERKIPWIRHWIEYGFLEQDYSLFHPSAWLTFEDDPFTSHATQLYLRVARLQIADKNADLDFTTMKLTNEVVNQVFHKVISSADVDEDQNECPRPIATYYMWNLSILHHVLSASTKEPTLADRQQHFFFTQLLDAIDPSIFTPDDMSRSLISLIIVLFDSEDSDLIEKLLLHAGKIKSSAPLQIIELVKDNWIKFLIRYTQRQLTTNWTVKDDHSTSGFRVFTIWGPDISQKDESQTRNIVFQFGPHRKIPDTYAFTIGISIDTDKDLSDELLELGSNGKTQNVVEEKAQALKWPYYSGIIARTFDSSNHALDYPVKVMKTGSEEEIVDDVKSLVVENSPRHKDGTPSERKYEVARYYQNEGDFKDSYFLGYSDSYIGIRLKPVKTEYLMAVLRQVGPLLLEAQENLLAFTQTAIGKSILSDEVPTEIYSLETIMDEIAKQRGNLTDNQ